MMKIVTIIGARPQLIKAAAISRAIAEHNRRELYTSRITEVLVHTGQHYDDDMSAIFIRELEIPEPNYNLCIGSNSHGVQTGQMLSEIEDILLQELPDIVLVYGDTNSTLAGALAASKIHIPIAHVEAGLRSFNRRMPEEINRIVTDHLSTLLFCPSKVAVENLYREGIVKGVLIAGDVMVDALQFAVTKSATHSKILASLNLKPQGYLLATVHRAENTDNKDRLRNIISALNDLEEIIVLPVHPRTRNILNDMQCKMQPHLRIIQPVGYFDMIALEKSARMILTDSGGIQKEAYWLKVPCITLRDETEWVETVENGWNRLTGADSTAIIDAVLNFMPTSKQAMLYGDGKAADKILQKIIKDYERK